MADDTVTGPVILELMGHRRLAGFLSEVEVAGASFLRLDIPSDPPMTQLYGPGSVYCITPTTEAIARAVASRYAQPAPVARWELEPPAPVPQRDPYDAWEPDDVGADVPDPLDEEDGD